MQAPAVLSPDNSVYLIDSSIYIYRAWHLTPKATFDLDGNPVNAVHGFAEFLLQLLSQTQARYLVCAFDHQHRPTVRQTIYPAYKSDRTATPESLLGQFALCQTLVELMGIKGIGMPTFEADDIIDTLAQHIRADNKVVCVVSADKDLTQCIGDNDIFWNFATKRKLDKQSIEKWLGIRPTQVADWLALAGDKVDTIPGVPGIGPATAARLLKKWGNIDMLFNQREQAASMKFRGAKAVADLLGEYEQQVREARRITGMFQVAELPSDTQQFLRTEIVTDKLNAFLLHNGFNEEQQNRIVAALQPAPAANS